MAVFGASKEAKLFKAGEAKASIGVENVILLQVQCQIQRQMNPVPTLTDGIIWAAQPVQGTLTASSIISASSGIKSILEKECKQPVHVEFGSVECEGNANVVIDIKDAYSQAVTISASGGQGYIGSDLVMQFTNATIS